MISTGIDMIEISRIKKSIKKPRFLKFIFSKEEIDFLKKIKFNVQSISAAFCAKEAFAKAMGSGFRGFSFRDINIFHDDLGKPYISLSGNAEKLFSSNILEISLSLTHTKNYACAVVVCINK